MFVIDTSTILPSEETVIEVSAPSPSPIIGILLIEFADPYPIPLFVTTATSTEPSTAESLTKLTSVLVDQCVGTGM